MEINIIPVFHHLLIPLNFRFLGSASYQLEETKRITFSIKHQFEWIICSGFFELRVGCKHGWLKLIWPLSIPFKLHLVDFPNKTRNNITRKSSLFSLVVILTS